MIRIVTDTTSCIPIEMMQAMGIDFVPQFITFGSHSYNDVNEISTEEFLNKLRASKQLPGTSAPPPSLYYPIFEKILAAGDQALVLAPTAELSGTFRSATLAAEEFDKSRIEIIDTRTIVGNLGSMVIKAHEWANAGMNLEEIKMRILDLSARDATYFLVPTMEYLHKGGRIGNAAKMFGTILQIVPILTLNEGKIDVYEKVRSLKQAIRTLVDLNVEICNDNPDASLTLGQCDSDLLVEQISEQFKERLNMENIPGYTAAPAIVVHTGPGLAVTSCFRKA